jgi:hypothetical protein
VTKGTLGEDWNFVCCVPRVYLGSIYKLLAF